MDVCPNFKFAELHEPKLFKAVALDYLLQIDTR